MKKRLFPLLSIVLGATTLLSLPGKTLAWFPYYEVAIEPAALFGYMDTSASNCQQEGYASLKSFDDPVGTFTHTVTMKNYEPGVYHYYFGAEYGTDGEPIDVPTFKLNGQEIHPVIEAHSSLDTTGHEGFLYVPTNNQHFRDQLAYLESTAALTRYDLTVTKQAASHAVSIQGKSIFLDAKDVANVSRITEGIEFSLPDGVDSLTFFASKGSVTTNYAHTLDETSSNVAEALNYLAAKEGVTTRMLQRYFAAYSERFPCYLYRDPFAENTYREAPDPFLLFRADVVLSPAEEEADVFTATRAGKLPKQDSLPPKLFLTLRAPGECKLTLEFDEASKVDYYNNYADQGGTELRYIQEAYGTACIALIEGKRYIPLDPTEPSQPGDVYLGILAGLLTFICPPFLLATVSVSIGAGGNAVALGGLIGFFLAIVAGVITIILVRRRRRRMRP